MADRFEKVAPPLLSNPRPALLHGLRDEEARILMNRSGARVGLDDRDVERTLRREITYTLASDKAIPISVNRGQPVVIDAPKSRVAKSFYDMARSLDAVVGSLR